MFLVALFADRDFNVTWEVFPVDSLLSQHGAMFVESDIAMFRVFESRDDADEWAESVSVGVLLGDDGVPDELPSSW